MVAIAGDIIRAKALDHVVESAELITNETTDPNEGSGENEHAEH